MFGHKIKSTTKWMLSFCKLHWPNNSSWKNCEFLFRLLRGYVRLPGVYLFAFFVPNIITRDSEIDPMRTGCVFLLLDVEFFFFRTVTVNPQFGNYKENHLTNKSFNKKSRLLANLPRMTWRRDIKKPVVSNISWTQNQKYNRTFRIFSPPHR